VAQPDRCRRCEAVIAAISVNGRPSAEPLEAAGIRSPVELGALHGKRSAQVDEVIFGVAFDRVNRGFDQNRAPCTGRGVGVGSMDQPKRIISAPSISGASPPQQAAQDKARNTRADGGQPAQIEITGTTSWRGNTWGSSYRHDPRSGGIERHCRRPASR